MCLWLVACLQCVKAWGTPKVKLWAADVLGLGEADAAKLKLPGSELLSRAGTASGLCSLDLGSDALSKVQGAAEHWRDAPTGQHEVLQFVCLNAVPLVASH